jgi:hypothetical protein
MMTLHFDFKDVFRAARMGLSVKKIWVQFCGLLIGIIGYAILSYLALLASGFSLGDVWSNYRFLPWPYGFELNLLGWVLWLAGLVFLVVVFLLSSTVVARLTYEQIQGNEFYEVKEGMKFLRQNWVTVLLSPLTLLGFVAFMLLCGIVAGLWGKIPWLGEISLGLAAIPLFLAGLFSVYLAVNFKVSILLTPAIVGTSKSDTFDSLFEVFSSLNSQPWRLLLYELLLMIVNLVATMIFAGAVVLALQVVHTTLGVLMGEKLTQVVDAARGYLPLCVNYPSPIPAWCGPHQLGGPGVMDLSWSRAIAGFFLGISLNLVWLIVYAYSASIWAVGQVLIYGVVVKKKDKRDLFLKSEEKTEGVKEEPQAQESKGD